MLQWSVSYIIMGDLINIVKINFQVYILKKHFTNKSREVNSFVCILQV